MDDIGAIAANIEAAEKARELLAFVESELASLEPRQRDRAWEKIITAELSIARRVVDSYPRDDVATPRPMSDAQAMAFEAEVMPFGKWAGSLVRDIPNDYFESLLDPSPFMFSSRRFVASDYFARRK